jgi:hypothetical protein
MTENQCDKDKRRGGQSQFKSLNQMKILNLIKGQRILGKGRTITTLY